MLPTRKKELNSTENIEKTAQCTLNLWNPGCSAYDFREKNFNFLVTQD